MLPSILDYRTYDSLGNHEDAYIYEIPEYDFHTVPCDGELHDLLPRLCVGTASILKDLLI